MLYKPETELLTKRQLMTIRAQIAILDSECYILGLLSTLTSLDGTHNEKVLLLVGANVNVIKALTELIENHKNAAKRNAP